MSEDKSEYGDSLAANSAAELAKELDIERGEVRELLDVVHKTRVENRVLRDKLKLWEDMARDNKRTASALEGIEMALMDIIEKWREGT
jgi:prephenate dehydrogenase